MTGSDSTTINVAARTTWPRTATSAMAMDDHGGKSFFGDPEGMLARVITLIADTDRMQTIGQGAFDVLLAVPGADSTRLCTLSYGAGSIVLQLAGTGVSFRAVALVHPGLPPASAEDWIDVTGTFLLCTGSEDPLCTPQQLLAFARALQAAEVDWRVNVYGGAKHGLWASRQTATGCPPEGLPTPR